MLSSAVAVVSRVGYGEMSVARITSDAGVSRRTFYDLFEDREDCFLAAFDEAARRARDLVVAAWEGQQGWREQTRAALVALLGFLDDEPGVATLLVVDALKAGPRVQERRAGILREVSQALHATGIAARAGRELPALTGEGVVGAVLTVAHTRLLESVGTPLVGLASELMGVIALPYLGAAVAARELARPLPPARTGTAHPQAPGGSEALVGLPMRMTRRTLLVLGVIAEHPGTSNRGIADAAGVSDQGQISKLLSRLQNLGLLENTTPGQPTGEPNQWQLTPHGQQIAQALQTHPNPNHTHSRRATANANGDQWSH